MLYLISDTQSLQLSRIHLLKYISLYCVKVSATMALVTYMAGRKGLQYKFLRRSPRHYFWS